MKTHRIILPAAQHAAALRSVDRLLLPLDLRRQGFDSAQPAGTRCRLEGHGWAWWGPLNEDGRALRYQQGVNCPYRVGDRLALLEPWGYKWTSGEPGYAYRYGDSRAHENDLWSPASRMPLKHCRCFYRVLAVEPVREGADWAWSVRVERWTK